MCLRVAHLNLQETLGHRVHLLDLMNWDAGRLLCAFMARYVRDMGRGTYCLLAPADARLIENSAARERGYGGHGW